MKFLLLWMGTLVGAMAIYVGLLLLFAALGGLAYIAGLIPWFLWLPPMSTPSFALGGISLLASVLFVRPRIQARLALRGL